MITFETKFFVYFDTSLDLALLHTSLGRILSNPHSVGMSPDDFTKEELISLDYLYNVTIRSSFFTIDEPDIVNDFFNIVEKICNRRKRAGFRKCEFPAVELKILQAIYDLIPKE